MVFPLLHKLYMRLPRRRTVTTATLAIIGLLLLTVTLIFQMGIAQIALTAATYGSFTLDAMWFAGSGVAFILLSLLIYVLLVGEMRKSLYLIGHFANGIHRSSEISNLRSETFIQQALTLQRNFYCYAIVKCSGEPTFESVD